MIRLYFGLPGSGKTTILAQHAYKYTHDKRSPYKNVYSNIPLDIKGVTYIDNDFIGKYDLSDGVILIDEATLFADSRDFKNFDADRLYYFMMHRHFKVHIELFLQQWDALDRKIRCITDKVYYIYRRGLFSHWQTKYYRIPYGIIIPDGKSDSQKLGEIVQGYCKPPFLVRLFASRVWRPRWYRYFNSWEHRPLPKLPKGYTPCVADKQKVPFVSKIKMKVGSVYGKIKEKKAGIRSKDKGVSSVDVSGQSGASESYTRSDRYGYSVSGGMASPAEWAVTGTGTDGFYTIDRRTDGNGIADGRTGDTLDKETRSHFTLL